MPQSSETRSYAYPKALRLRKQGEFDAVYQAGVVKNLGPLRVLGKPNELGHCRLGLNVSGRVGKAVVRNRIKRLLREAFRLSRYDLTGAYDLIVIVRPHEPLKLPDYQRLLLEAVAKLDRHWKGKTIHHRGAEDTEKTLDKGTTDEHR